MSAVPLSHQPGLKNDDWAQRAVAIDWPTTTEALHQQGNAVLPQLLSATECAALARLYGNADESTFRSRVVMQRHGFGQGEYRYFCYPLPDVVAGLPDAVAFLPVAARGLQQILEQESKTNELLTQIAERMVNRQAKATAGNGQRRQ